MANLIKSQCGMKKYETLKKQSGFFNRIRFYSFFFSAIIVDFFKYRDKKNAFNKN